ncbi:serine hydrolase domain-containing protein [Rufibacter latericius]|uniref:Class A beta-lactamase-related serine hydrolase n=1 Tax=Rufibacter latericius TaxID=2487040 RepID=A0A3M9MV00_9BACT|nr:serine hydrolase domain-containing protein [Rufibacter latericius]RNI28733.1 class A beta-lactamase-related serine hydrolase [Rufibacter latericius]
MNKIIYALLFISLTAFSFKLPPTGKKDKKPPVIINKTVKARIDAALRSFVDSGRVAGASALIFEKNKEVYHNAFGYADREAKAKMDRNTIVRIYSMTKPVTGVALMKLYEKGAFKLDDPLSKYAPEFANMKVYKGVDASGNLILEPLKRPITVRDITRHTAGFATTTDLPGISDVLQKADLSNPNNTLEQMVKKLASLPLLFQPGEQWSYGPSVDVQAYLVERLSGKPFAQYLQENIFMPLGMTNTRYVVPEDDKSRFAATYRKGEEGQLTRVPDLDNLFNTKDFALKPGGWGLTSTLDDYMKFARMLVSKGTLGKARILKPETVKLMATNQLSDSVTQRMWLPSKGQVGFGIDFAVRLHPPVSKEENNGAVGEFFWDGAASTLFWVDPVNDLTAVLFVQVFPFDGQVHKRFRDAVYGPFSAK